MNINERKTSIIQKVVMVFLLLVSISAAVKTVFVSLDIDETYSLTMSARLVLGDRLITDLWDPHQLSAILLVPFLKLFYLIRGDFTGAVIFSRIIGTVLHILIGGILYHFAVTETKLSKFQAYLLFILHFSFLPKWVQMPEFELQQYWCMLLLWICLWKADGIDGETSCRKDKLFCVAAGFFLFWQLFSYPSLLLLYPVFVCLFIREKKTYRIIPFTLGAAVPGVLFLGTVLIRIGFNELLYNVRHIISDESHTTVGFAEKWLIYGRQLTEELPLVLLLLLAAFLSAYVLKTHVFWTYMALSSLWQVAQCLFFDGNQFSFYSRFLGYLILVFLMSRFQKSTFLRDIGIIGVCCLICILLITNMDLSTASAKVFYLIPLTVCYLWGEKEIPIHDKTSSKVYSSVACLVLIGGLLLCKGVMIRITGCTEATIKAPLTKIQDGPAKGIYMWKESADILEADRMVLENNVSEEDSLLCMTGESIMYLWTKADTASPSTQGTAAFNQVYVDYFEHYSDKLPSVVVYDKEMQKRDYYVYFDSDQLFLDYLSEKGYRPICETDSLILYRND